MSRYSDQSAAAVDYGKRISGRYLSHNLSDITECPICMTEFRHPKSLPCIHTFCLSCLQEYGIHRRPGDRLACPICCQFFTVPPGGIDKLPNNFIVQNLLEELRQGTGPGGGQSVGGEGNGGRKGEYCTVHTGCLLELFCYRCLVVICVKCFSDEHSSHDCSDVDKSSDKYRQELEVFERRLEEEVVTRLGEILAQLNNELRDQDHQEQLEQEQEWVQEEHNIGRDQIGGSVDRERRSLLRQISDSEREMNKECDEFVILINQCRSEFTAQFTVLQRTRLSQLTAQLVDVENSLVKVEQFKDELKKVKDEGSSCDLTRHGQGLLKRGRELIADSNQVFARCQSITGCDLGGSVVFKASTGRRRLSTGRQLIGTIVCRHCNKGVVDGGRRWLRRITRYGLTVLAIITLLLVAHCIESSAPQIQLVDVRRVEGAVWGLTQLNERIYVIYNNRSNHLLIYDSSTFRRVWKMILDRTTTTTCHDMTASRRGQGLFVYEWHKERVMRLTVDGSQTHIDLRNPAHSYVYTLSVTSADDHLLLLQYNPPRLDIYGTDGRLLRVISLPREMVEPRHAVMTHDASMYVIIHGYRDSLLHRVCLVSSSDGRVLRSYGGPRGDGQGQLSYPMHVAVDVNGNIYVADYGNNRVLILDTNLRLIQVLTAEFGPIRLSYDERAGRLLVGLISGHVLVYSVRPHLGRHVLY